MRTNTTAFYAMLFLFAFGANITAAQNLPLDKNVRTGKLPNGFTYFIRHNTEPKKRVDLYLVNKVGSILEDDDQRGLAHFMEHINFNGTKHFPKSALVDYLQKAGVRFGADLNAYTSFDETVYQLPLPTDNPELLKNGFMIMRDWAQEATLDANEINNERGVVLEEKRLGKGAAERMQRLSYPILFNNSRYAERLPIGTDNVLDNFKPEVIRRYHHDWYRPDLQALIVVGDIDVNKTEKLIKAQFGTLKNPLHEKLRTKYKIELKGENHFLVVTDPEQTSTSLQVLIKHKSQPLKTAVQYKQAIIKNLFNQMLAERYAELSRQPNPPFISGAADIDGFMSGIDAYSVSIDAKPGQFEAGFKAIWRETIRAQRFGFTQSELDRAKINYMAGMDAAIKEADKTPSESYVKEYQEYFLNGTAAPGIRTEYQLVKSSLPQINLAAVNALAKAYIKDTNRDIIIQAPEADKAGMPDEKTVLEWIAGVNAEHLVAYVDDDNSLQLLAQSPLAGTVVKETTKNGVTELALSNGLKVVLKPTAFKNNEINFTAFAPGGTSVYSDADYQSAANASNIIPAGGLGQYNTTQLSKMLAGKTVSVQPYIGEISQGISGSSTINDLETALQLTYLYFTAPRKDSTMFNNIISASKDALLNRGNDPGSVFADTTAAIFGNHNVRRTGPTIEKLNQITLNRSLEIYQERFADASNFTFVFTGSFDPEKIKPLLLQYLGTLPATHNHEEAIDLGLHAPAGKVEQTVYKGTEPKATVELAFTGDYQFSDFNNGVLNALAEVLEIRLLERLREEEAGVYSPSCSASFTKLPSNRYGISISFGCAPKNVDKLIASVLDEIVQLKKNGPAAVNIEKYKAQHRRSMETALQTNEFWQGYLTSQYQNGEAINAIAQDAENQSKLSIEVLKKGAQQYFGDNYIRLVLMPEQKNKVWVHRWFLP
jgi:zinc protease